MLYDFFIKKKTACGTNHRQCDLGGSESEFIAFIFTKKECENVEWEIPCLKKMKAIKLLIHQGHIGGGSSSGSGNRKVAGSIPGLCLAKCRGVPEQDAT